MRLVCLAFCLLFASLNAVHAQSFKAALDRSTITLGESAVLSLTIEGANFSRPPTIAAPANLQITYRSQSSQMSFGFGQQTSSTTYDYLVVPTQVGEYDIPAVQAVIDKKTVTTQPLHLRVLKGTPGATNSDGTVKRAFLKLIAPQKGLYVGEVVPIELQLYVTAGEDIQIPQLEGEGFLLGKMPQPAQTRTQLNNIIYTVFTFKLSASPLRAGKLKLGPAQTSLIIHLPMQGRRGRDPLDSFPDPFEVFGPRVIKQPMRLVVEPLEVEVLPLPSQNVPADFAGAVGDFSLAISASPTNVAVGDPVTLKVQLTGKGALEQLSLPQKDWREFRAYPPSSSVQTTDPLGIVGSKTFEQVLIPQNADVKELPEFSFSFFDPVQRAYRTLRQPPIPLTVRPNTGATPQPLVATGVKPAAEAPTTRDIVHIKPYLGMVGAWQQPLLQRPWFLWLQTVPLLAWVTALIWRKRSDWLAKDPRLRRRLQVDQFVKAHLKELPRLAQANAADEFFATVFRLLQERIGERLNLPASAITEAVLEEQLAAWNLSPELLTSLRDLFQACNQARYAPVRPAHELMAFVPAVESVLQQLRELKNEK